MSGRIMVVEDDPTLLTVVGDYLRASGYDVTCIADGREAETALKGGLPDVLILDRMLPGIGGDALCLAMRARAPELPIIMMTALGEVEHRIGGLEHGADDYLTKPFSLRELQLRIEAVLRRSQNRRGSPAPYTVGAFRVDPVRRRVWVREREVVLTGREYELLVFLIQNIDRTVTREEILREVWGWSFGEATTVTVHVRRLREKVEADPREPEFLLTEWGAGYRLRGGHHDADRR